MKIYYITSQSMPSFKAEGLFLVKMCESFAKFGNELELIYPWRFKQDKASVDSFYDLEKSFETKSLLCLDLISFGFGKWGHYISTISYLMRLKIFLLTKKYDVLYTRDELVGLFFKKYILEMHKLPNKKTFVHIYLWKKADKIITLTNFLKQELIAVGVEENKIMVRPDAVDFDKYDIDVDKHTARINKNLPQDKKLIGYIGMLRTMGMEKGIDIAIKTLSKLGPDYNLVLVGGVPDDIVYYKSISEKFSVADRIIFCGWVKNIEIPMYLKAFDILIAPFPDNHHYSYYMSPMKIFEYMVSKRPIIASDLPSVREVLNENNAYLVKPDSEDDILKAIKEIEAYSKNSEIKAERAYEESKKYTWLKRAEYILGFIGK